MFHLERSTCTKADIIYNVSLYRKATSGADNELEPPELGTGRWFVLPVDRMVQHDVEVCCCVGA
jgi:hypothetical protein